MTENLQPALIHLTGPRRGTRHPVDAEELLIGTSAEADVHVPADERSDVLSRHATLRRDERGWFLVAEPDAALFINGETVSVDRLLPSDVVQLGEQGPLLRFRLEPASGSEYKSLRDAIADCVACGRYGADSLAARVGLFLEAMPYELFTQRSPRLRTLMVSGLVIGLAVSTYQVVQSRQLGNRLTETRARLEEVVTSLRASQEWEAVTPAILDSLRRSMTPVGDRTGSVGPEILADAPRSVIFVQGTYGFVDSETGRPLHVRRDPATGTLRRVSPGEGGERLHRRYTGTAFAVTPEGHFVTNRHLVRPWDHDAVSRSLREMGFRPEPRRLMGYLPGREHPVDLELVAQSDSADLALLRASGLELSPNPLPLARDPWKVAGRLAAQRAISPLTTRGIVGQVTSTAVVYDAETSQGGSGGPLLGPDGRVVAVNKGLMPEFSGSNLGVLVRYVRRLLQVNGI